MKRIVLFVVLMFGLSLAPLAVSAQTPVDSLTALAEYFPEDTNLFIAMRTDDGFFQTLDEVVSRVTARIPNADVPNKPVSVLLDSVAQIFDGEDFETTIRPWLGDSLVFSIPSVASAFMGGDLSAVVAFSIADHDAAEFFLDNYILPIGIYGRTGQEDGSILYENDGLGYHFLLRGDVLLATYGNSPRVLMQTIRTPLTESETFQTALATLPEDGYNIIAYANTGELLAPLVFLAPMLSTEEFQVDARQLSDVLDALGGLVMGFTIEAGRSFIWDTALVVNDPTPFTEAGLTLGDLPPIDLTLMEHIPSQAIAVMQNQGLGTGLVSIVNLLGTLDTLLAASGTTPLDLFGRTGDPALNETLSTMNFQELADYLRTQFSDATGLTIDEAFGWMTGDFVVQVGLIRLDNDLLPFAPDFSLVVSVNDADAAGNLIDGLERALEQSGVPYERSDDTVRLIVSSNPEPDEPDLRFGQNGEILAAGLRSSVDFALNGDGQSLYDDPVFQAASAHFLPETHSLWYFTALPFIPAFDSSFTSAEARLFALLESFSLSAISDENGTGVVRAVFTLGE